MATYQYPIIIEIGERNCSAYSPDVPGCIATGKTVEETIGMMKEALQFHIQGLKEEGLPIPRPGKAIKQKLSDKELLTGIQIAA